MGGEADKGGVSKLVSFRHATTGELVRYTMLVKEGQGTGGKEVKVKQPKKKKKKSGDKKVVVWEQVGNSVIPKIGGVVAEPEIENDWRQR